MALLQHPSDFSAKVKRSFNRIYIYTHTHIYLHIYLYIDIYLYMYVSVLALSLLFFILSPKSSHFSLKSCQN